MPDQNSTIDAARLHSEGELSKAFELYLELAERGDADACLMVAFMYAHGEGVGLNFEESIRWDLRAVELGSVSALLNLGITYRMKGQLREARKCFQAAADRGDGEALVELAKLLDVSDLERETVVDLLRHALESEDLTEGTQEDATAMLSEVRSSNSGETK